MKPVNALLDVVCNFCKNNIFGRGKYWVQKWSTVHLTSVPAREEARKARLAAIEAYCNDTNNEKKFFKDTLSVFGAPADPEFGIMTQHTPALRRKVEVF